MTTVRVIGLRAIEGDSWQVPVVNETLTVITCEFHRYQFPSETYTVDFSATTGVCLDARFTCVKLDIGEYKQGAMVMPL